MINERIFVMDSYNACPIQMHFHFSVLDSYQQILVHYIVLTFYIMYTCEMHVHYVHVKCMYIMYTCQIHVPYPLTYR